MSVVCKSKFCTQLDRERKLCLTDKTPLPCWFNLSMLAFPLLEEPKAWHVYSYFIYMGCDPFNIENMFRLFEILLKYNDADTDILPLKTMIYSCRQVLSDADGCLHTFCFLTSQTPCYRLSARESSAGQGVPSSFQHWRLKVSRRHFQRFLLTLLEEYYKRSKCRRSRT